MWLAKHSRSITILFFALCAVATLLGRRPARAQEQKVAPMISGFSSSLVADKPAAVLSSVTRRWWRDSEGHFHFSPGRKWVPVARGSAQKRAQDLGLISVEAVRNLLRSTPSRPLLAAAGNEKPTKLLWPVVKGTWGRGFGFTRVLRPELRHNGIDIGAPMGAPVRAAAAGIVIYSDNALSGYGNCVIILHPNGWITTYAHNLRNTVQPGWRVKRGERIALIGSTGASGGLICTSSYANGAAC